MVDLPQYDVVYNIDGESLKACPFCSGIPKLETEANSETYRVHCPSCGVYTTWYANYNTCINRWNMRHNFQRDPDDELTYFSIYEEGYEATGESGKAHYVGRGYGKDFLDACKMFIRNTGYGEIYTTRGGKEYAGNWGCFWYPTMEEAQKSFG